MIVDCHTHLSTNDQWGEEFTRAFGKAYVGTGIDLHTTPERHWSAMGKVDRAIVFGINSIFLRMNTPNNAIAEYAKAHPGKIIGFMSIDPRDPHAIDELERCVHDLKLKGIKMSPVYQGYDPMDSRAQDIYRHALKYNLPILVHAAFQSIPQTPMKWANPLLFDEVGIHFPDLKIILAHMGVPWSADALVVVRKHRNIYADISGVPSKRWWGYQALLSFNEFRVADKLLFGSDFPIFTVEDTIQELLQINDVAHGTKMPRIPESLMEEIIHRDTLRLLEIE